jgi:hypothetical protein
LSLQGVAKVKALASGANKRLKEMNKDSKESSKRAINGQKNLFDKTYEGDSRVDMTSTYKEGINQMSEMELDS